MKLNKAEAILEVLKSSPDLSNKEIVEKVWNDYQISTTESSVATVKSRKSQGLVIQSDVDIDTSSSSDSGSLLDHNESITNNLHNDIGASLSVDNDRPNVAVYETPVVAEQSQEVRLEQIPSGGLDISLEKAEVNKEAPEMAKNYVEKVRQIKADETDGSTSDIDDTLPAMETSEEIDAGLLSDNLLEVSDLAVSKVGEPLRADEKKEGRKAITRVIQKRISWIVPYGDLVNLGLWFSKVFLRRVFRVRPKLSDKERKANR